MVISGDTISEEQAADVILSTGFTSLDSTNMRTGAFSEIISKYSNRLIPMVEELSKKEYFINKNKEFYFFESDHRCFQIYLAEQIGLTLRNLDISFLYNNIAAPNGAMWCNNVGNIYAVKTIGSYPTGDYLIRDSTLIAKTFPYLNINISIYDYTSHYGAQDIHEPLFNIEIKNGKARFKEFNINDHSDVRALKFHSSDIKRLLYTENAYNGFIHNHIIRKKIENAIIYELAKISTIDNTFREIILKYKWW